MAPKDNFGSQLQIIMHASLDSGVCSMSNQAKTNPCRDFCIWLAIVGSLLVVDSLGAEQLEIAAADLKALTNRLQISALCHIKIGDACQQGDTNLTRVSVRSEFGINPD
ncbi:MAG: hypothetical protein GKR91_17360 [Pseudomonadales bacterium]|nr:hypothetical protein [Pseudomonadales bacterium]